MMRQGSLVTFTDASSSLILIGRKLIKANGTISNNRKNFHVLAPTGVYEYGSRPTSKQVDKAKGQEGTYVMFKCIAGPI